MISLSHKKGEMQDGLFYDLHHIFDCQDIRGNSTFRSMDHVPSIQDILGDSVSA